MSQATMTTLPPRGMLEWCVSCVIFPACQFLDRSPPLPNTQPPPSWAGSGAAGTRQILKQTSRQSLHNNGKQKEFVHDCYMYRNKCRLWRSSLRQCRVIGHPGWSSHEQQGQHSAKSKVSASGHRDLINDLKLFKIICLLSTLGQVTETVTTTSAVLARRRKAVFWEDSSEGRINDD